MLSASRVLMSKQDLLNEYKMKIGLLSDRLDINQNNILKNKRYCLGVLGARLNAISPLNTLSRGYTIVNDQNAKIVSSVENVSLNDKIELIMSDGKITAIVSDIKKTEE